MGEIVVARIIASLTTGREFVYECPMETVTSDPEAAAAQLNETPDGPLRFRAEAISQGGPKKLLRWTPVAPVVRNVQFKRVRVESVEP